MKTATNQIRGDAIPGNISDIAMHMINASAKFADWMDRIEHGSGMEPLARHRTRLC